jgi:hypothetical protein
MFIRGKAITALTRMENINNVIIGRKTKWITRNNGKEK